MVYFNYSHNNPSVAIPLFYQNALNMYHRGDTFGASNAVRNMQIKLLGDYPDIALEFANLSHKPLAGDIEDATRSCNEGDILTTARILNYLEKQFYSGKSTYDTIGV